MVWPPATWEAQDAAQFNAEDLVTVPDFALPQLVPTEGQGAVFPPDDVAARAAEPFPPPHWYGPPEPPFKEEEAETPERGKAATVAKAGPHPLEVVDPYGPRQIGPELPPGYAEQHQYDDFDVVPTRYTPEERDVLGTGTPESQKLVYESELERRRGMTDEQLAVEGVKDAERQGRLVREREIAALEADRKRAGEIEEDRKAAAAEARVERDSILAEAKAISETKVGSENWWASRSTGQGIAAFMTAVLGGLLAPHRGGRNDGLNMIFELIDKDIETQRTNLTNRRQVLSERRGLYGELVAAGKDDYQAATIARHAAYDSMLKEIDLFKAQVDPAGMAAQRVELARRGVLGKKAAAAQKDEDRARAYNLKLREQKREDDKLVEQRRARRAASGRANARMKWEAGEREKDRQLKRDLAAQKAAGKGTGPSAELQFKMEKDARERTVNLPGGKGFATHDGPRARKLQAKVTSTEKLISLLDEATALRSKMSIPFGETGPVFEVLKTDERRRLDTIQGILTGTIKETDELGALDNGVIRLVQSQAGDLGGLSDPTAKLQKMREAAVDDLRTSVRNGFDPKSNPGMSADDLLPDLPNMSKGYSGTSDEDAVKNMQTYEVPGLGKVPVEEHRAYVLDWTARGLGDRDDVHSTLMTEYNKELTAAANLAAKIDQRKSAAGPNSSAAGVEELEAERQDHLQRAENYKDALVMKPEDAVRYTPREKPSAPSSSSIYAPVPGEDYSADAFKAAPQSDEEETEEEYNYSEGAEE